jgi:transposase
MSENKTNQRVKRKKFSPQFKDQALERAAKDGVAQAAEDLGIGESLLYSWRTKQRKYGQPLEEQKLQQSEFARLKRENARLEEENAFLKKAAAYFAKDSKRGTS